MTKTDKLLLASSLISATILVIILNLTTPSEIGPIGVLLFFTTAYILCLSLMTALCRLFFWIKKTITRTKTSGTKKRKSYYYGSVLAFAPISLIFMRSFGQLNILEITLVAALVILGCFYVSKKA